MRSHLLSVRAFMCKHKQTDSRSVVNRAAVGGQKFSKVRGRREADRCRENCSDDSDDGTVRTHKLGLVLSTANCW